MKIYVIGGGAAGMMAAIAAKETNPDAEVHLVEKNDKLGKKIFITGKGRGNATNACDIEEFFKNYVTNPRFLYSALYSFTNHDVIDLLEKNGCRTKTERGDRVFPASDHAYSITDALKHYIKKLGVDIHYKTEVRAVTFKKDQVAGIAYPSTGSTGDGYRFAKDAGIEVTETYPSLVCLTVHEPDIFRLKGLTLKNIAVRITEDNGKTYYKEFGDLDFMEDSLRGPVIISASAVLTKYLNAYEPSKKKPLTVHIDLKPAWNDSQLDERLLRDFQEFKNKELRNAFSNLFPSQLIPVFNARLEQKGTDINRKVSEVSRETRKVIIDLIRNFDYTVSGTGSFKEAIVTQGGVSVKEISPNTMESKKVKGLYFAGEVLDVDGYTGGFNMQMAFSTGHLAGQQAALT